MFAVDLEYLNTCSVLCMYMYRNLVIYTLLLTYIDVYRSLQIHSETHRGIYKYIYASMRSAYTYICTLANEGLLLQAELPCAVVRALQSKLTKQLVIKTKKITI